MMKRLMLAALILLATRVPADAQTATAAVVAKSEAGRERTIAREHLAASALIPFKIAAVGTAAVIGTPIAIVRCETKRLDTYSNAVRTELDAPDGSLPLVVASVPGQSLRAIGTLGAGVLNGLFNATESWNRPFSRESFSLGNLHLID